MTKGEGVRWRLLIAVCEAVYFFPLAWVSRRRAWVLAGGCAVVAAVDAVAAWIFARRIRERGPRHLSPLDQAVRASDYHSARQLIASGAGIDDWDDLGMTVLLYAVYRGDVEGTRFLLENGANPNQESRQGTTPLWHAVEDFGLDEVADVLRAHGARAAVVRTLGT